MEGADVRRFFADPVTGRYGYREDETHTLMKVETHNHPTAISPFPGAATGSGGEIRDEGATGRGSKPKAGLCGFSVSNLRIPGFERPWEGPESKPDRIASPLAIMIEGPIGAASFNNEFGRPNLAGYFRTYEQEVGGRAARLPQAHHAGRRRGQHPRRRTRTRRTCRPARCSSRLAGRPCSSGWAAARPRRCRPARTPRTSTSTPCSAATRRSSGARRKSSTAAGRWATRIRSSRFTTSAPADCRTPCPRSPTAPAAARASTCARRRTKSPA